MPTTAADGLQRIAHDQGDWNGAASGKQKEREKMQILEFTQPDLDRFVATVHRECRGPEIAIINELLRQQIEATKARRDNATDNVTRMQHAKGD